MSGNFAMKWSEIKVLFESEDSAFAADLIAAIFYDLGLQGVLIDDPTLTPTEGWAENAVQRSRQHAVTGFWPFNKEAENRYTLLQKRLKQLETSHRILSRLICRSIDEDEWAETWKVFFKPLRICTNIVIKPKWETFNPRPDDTVINIDPGMAFGTGSHPTTHQCISFIRRYLKQGDSFLDVGTGSGILSIAAAGLGARRIVGVDLDETAVTIAKENLTYNNIHPDHFCLICGNLVDAVGGRFDMIAANILTGVILELLPDLHRVIQPNGIFICSGILEDSKDTVIKAMKRHHFKILYVQSKDSWVGITAMMH